MLERHSSPAISTIRNGNAGASTAFALHAGAPWLTGHFHDPQWKFWRVDRR